MRLSHRPLLNPTRLALITSVAAAAALLAACGGDKKPAATQVAAKVNKEEISVHRVNYMLQRIPGMTQEQAPAASKQVLNSLIDQEIAVQKAVEMKLDRDPSVAMTLDAGRREILARAYAEKITEAAPKPTADDIKAYYASKPALFAQRRVYNLVEVAVEGEPTKAPQITAIATKTKNAEELSAALKSADIRHAIRRAQQPAENLPLGLIDQIASLGEGKALPVPTPGGLRVIYVSGSTAAPLSEAEAKASIEAFLLNDRKRKIGEEAIKTARNAAKIELVGAFAGTDAAAGLTTEAKATPPAAASTTDKSLDKGISSLK